MLASPYESRLAIKDITSVFVDRHGNDYERKITTKWIGNVIRKRLQLHTFKGGAGTYEIHLSDTTTAKLDQLYARYGIDGVVGEPAEAAEITEKDIDPHLRTYEH
jgi:hypothetical protein